MPGIVRPARRPADWVPPGPLPGDLQGRPDLLPRAGEDLSFLAGNWRLYQKLHGHRWSLDDLVTAAVAARAVDAPGPRSLLDLGSGIGSVLLLLAFRFERARCIGLEAQAESVELARRSIRLNGVESRVAVRHTDFRRPWGLPPGSVFDLVTGTPPYFTQGRAVSSGEPQRRFCRFEERGGIEEYLAAGARFLAPRGRLVFCASTLLAERVRSAVSASALRELYRYQVTGKAGKAPLFSVYVLTRSVDSPPDAPPVGTTELLVRDREGAWTAEFRALRREMGLPDEPR